MLGGTIREYGTGSEGHSCASLPARKTGRTSRWMRSCRAGGRGREPLLILGRLRGIRKMASRYTLVTQGINYYQGGRSDISEMGKLRYDAGSAGAETADDTKKLEFRLKLLREEIDRRQANIFDQIDGKTGVALGFTFVVVVRFLASVSIGRGEGHLPSMCQS